MIRMKLLMCALCRDWFCRRRLSMMTWGITITTPTRSWERCRFRFLSPASQKEFERGVALMHSFEYEEAEAQSPRSQRPMRVARWRIGELPSACSTRYGSGRSLRRLSGVTTKWGKRKRSAPRPKRAWIHRGAGHFLWRPIKRSLSEAGSRVFGRDGKALPKVSGIS